MSASRLILASGSPRRRSLLADAGYEFDVVPPRDEAECGVCTSSGPANFVVGLAARKADDVCEQLRQRDITSSAILLAADTVAECHGQILGKPANEEHARDMLRRMSGQRHRVYTGYSLRRLADGQVVQRIDDVAVTTLLMDVLSDEWLDQYVETGLWEGKAGAFGYQDGLDWVHVVEGSESNVVGLPTEVVFAHLAAWGIVPRTPS